MYCSKCGNELREGSLFCPKCGNKIDIEKTKNFVTEDCNEKDSIKENIDSERLKIIKKITKEIKKVIILKEKQEKVYQKSNEENIIRNVNNNKYVFFNFMNARIRSISSSILGILSKIILWGTVALTFFFINDCIKNNENYKLIVYIIQYINSFSWIFLVEYIVNSLVELLEMDDSKFINRNKISEYKKYEFISIGCSVLGYGILAFPSTSLMLSYTGVAIAGNIVDLLYAIKGPIILFIISFVLNNIKNNYLKEKDNENE